MILIETIEVYCQGKYSEERCEDAWLVTEDLAAVIDGVTAKGRFTYEGKTTGRLAAELVYDVLENLDRTADFAGFLEAVNRRMEAFYENVDFPESRREKGLQAVCAVYSDLSREIWLIGDCQAAVDGVVYASPKRSDQVLAGLRSLAIHLLMEEKMEPEQAQKEARRLIEPWILKATAYANREDSPYGYAVLNGEKIPESLIRRIPLDDGSHEIILASDGYPRIKGTLKGTEEYLRQVLKDDPACCTRFCSTKGKLEGQSSFDDQTYLRFRVNPM
ncbi:MAG TPA: hypothetical protein IAA57_11870 [Candidatus Pullilachnospira intestinigallinarum]|nr:hypothetical protein [Candidatus Pullilachnospira intestinigallinarum]